MKKSGIIFLSFFFVVSSFGYLSCKKNKAGQGIKTSSYNDNSSHDVGTACMNCHNSGGSNSYWWTIAGTVYKPDTSLLNSNSTVYLFTAVNGSGTLTVLLPVDAIGNFYTSSLVDFRSGLFPVVKSSSGETRYMQSSVTNGNCNSCHNRSRRIIVN
jgi:cytochrome c553